MRNSGEKNRERTNREIERARKSVCEKYREKQVGKWGLEARKN